MIHQSRNLGCGLLAVLVIAFSWPAIGDEATTFEWPADSVFDDAMSGSADAQWQLASFYLNNHIEEDQGLEQPGTYWLQTAADNGSSDAINEVGFGYLYGEFGFEADPMQAQAWFIKGVGSGNSYSAYNLATMYRDGIGFSRDDYLATYWLQRSANLGMQEAMYEVAFRYGEGVGSMPNPDRKSSMLEALVVGGFDPYQWVAGDREGTVVEIVEMREALDGDELSAAHLESFPDELAALLISYDEGINDVFDLLLKAAQLGSVAAQEKVAAWYESGQLTDGVSEEDANYWRKRADKNPD